MTRPDPLAAHVRRLGNQDLNELLVQLPKPTFAALVESPWLGRSCRPGAAALRAGPRPRGGRLLPASPSGHLASRVHLTDPDAPTYRVTVMGELDHRGELADAGGGPFLHTLRRPRADGGQRWSLRPAGR